MKTSVLAAALAGITLLPAWANAVSITNAGLNTPGTGTPVLTGAAVIDNYPGGTYLTAMQQPEEGSGVLVLHGVGTATLTITGMTSGSAYKIMYGEAQQFGAPASDDMQVKVAGVVTDGPFFPFGAPWVDRGFTFMAGATSSPLEFDGLYSAGTGTAVTLVDNVRITPVTIWKSTTSGSWTTGANWTGSTAPNGTDQNVIFGQSGANGAVNLTANQTIGSLEFNGVGGPYTISTTNTSTLSLGTGSGATTILVTAAVQTINAGVTLTSDVTVNLPNNSSRLVLGGAFNAAGKSITQVGPGRIDVPNVTAADLIINGYNQGGGTVHVNANGSAANVSVLNHLNFAGITHPQPRGIQIVPYGTLDLQDNDLILKSGYNADEVRTLIQYGYDFGDWLGQGLTARAATMTSHTGLGYLSGSDYTTLRGNPATPTFDGKTIAASDVLVKYTYLGDADLDGKITLADYAQIDAGFFFGAATPMWVNGDFNYDGVVNYMDYAIIDASFASQGSPLAADMIDSHEAEFGAPYIAALNAATVPEPASLGLLAIGTAALLAGKRRR